MYSKRMLGGFAIVAGGIPVATGAALSCKYLNKRNEISISFFGDGAVAQGVFHESLNIASMWSLPCLYVIENNKWSMGTPLVRTLANYELFPRKAAESYDMPFFLLDGMDMLNCYAGFSAAHQYVRDHQKPALVECRTERFRGHSISDPGLYRSKEELKKGMERDPILLMKQFLIDRHVLTEESYQQIEEECRNEIAKAAQKANADPWPDPRTLEEDVMAPMGGRTSCNE
jgi:pyruvate dehydrogenase E1 component alpha subunit